jgi:hypothetical protein
MKQWKEFKRENMAHEEWQKFDNDFHLQAEVGEHASMTLGKSWVLQNCNLDDNLHNYGHANSNRRTVFLESPCA